MLKRFVSFVGLVLFVAFPGFAASPHAGFYIGAMHTSITGSVNLPERPIDPVAFTISSDGQISSFSDLNGTVTDAGDVTWNGNSTGFATGKIVAGVLTSSVSIDHQNGVVSHFRIEAKNGGPGIGEANTLAGRFEQLHPSGGIRNLSRVRFSDGHFYGVGPSGAFARSYDGINWTRTGVPTVLALYDVAYGNGRYVVVGDSGARFWSTNGLDWVPSPAGNGPYAGVAFGNGKFVCADFQGGVSTSTDGVAWAPSGSLGGGFVYSGIDFMNGEFVGWNGSTIKFSADASDWTQKLGSTPVGNITVSLDSHSKVAFGNGAYLVGGQQGLARSTDGVNWTKMTNGAGTLFGAIGAVGFGNGKFVVSDLADELWTSTDGIAWKHVDKIEFRSIAYGLDMFVGVGDRAYTSADSELWVDWQRNAFLPDFRESGYLDPYPLTNVVASFVEGGSGTFSFGYNGLILWYKHPFANGSGTAPQLTAETLRAAMNLRYNEAPVIVGNRGAMIVPDDRSTMTFTLVPAVTSADLVNGAHNDNNTLVFVGTGGAIVRNTDATKTNWTAVPSGTTANLKHVAWYPNYRTSLTNLFIAVGDRGTILTSPDGASWTRRDSGVTLDLVGSAVRERPRSFLVAATDGTLLESTNGVAWTRTQSLPVPRMLRTFGNTRIEDSFAIVGRGDNALAVTSLPLFPNEPAVRFTMAGVQNLGAQYASDIAIGNGRYVAAGDRISAFSFDSKNWLARSHTQLISSLTYGDCRFVAVGGSTISISSDGLRWQPLTNIAPTKSFRAITYGGSRFAAVGSSGLIMISDDGLVWRDKSIASSVTFNEVTYGNGGFLAGGTSGHVVSSTDLGETWIEKPTLLTEIKGVTWGNGQWVAVALNGWTGVSTNGQNWQNKQHPYISPVENRPDYSKVTFAAGVYYASTARGEISTSTNGLDWKRNFTGVGLQLLGSTPGNGGIFYAAQDQIYRLSIPDSDSPNVTAQPASQEVAEGATLTLTANASGSGLEYAWLKDGVALSNGGRVVGANSTTLTIAGVKPEDAGRYTFVVSNSAGSRSSYDAEVRVALKPAITRHPSSGTIILGARAALSIEFEAEGTIQWFKNGVAISGANTTEFAIGSVTLDDAGAYYAEVTNAAGAVRSIPAVLNIVSAPAGLTLDPSWPAAPIAFAVPNSTYIEALAAQPDGKILVGGYFKVPHPNGGFFENIMRLNADGSLDASFPALAIDNAPATFHTLANGQLLVMGWFDKLANVSTKGLARLNPDGTLDTGYQPGAGPAFQGPIWALPRKDGKLLVSGAFSLLASVSNRYVGLLKPDGMPDPTFIPAKSLNNEVSTLDVQSDGAIVIAGKFSAPRSRVARLTASGTEDTTFNAGGAGIGAGVAPYTFPQIYRVLVGADDKIYVGGFFGTYNGTTSPSLIRLTANGTVDASFNAQMPGNGQSSITDLEPYGADLLVGGSFRHLGGNSNYANIVLLGPTGAPAAGLSLSANPDGNVRHIAPAPGGFVLGGSFNHIDGKAKPRLARLKAGNSGAVPLAIRMQPQPVVAKIGQHATLAVAASGDSTLSFQWRKNGEALAGETRAVLTIPEVSETHTGSYTVEVKDNSGAIISSAAALTLEQSAGVGFAEWAARFSLPANANGLTHDADNDGYSNAAEFAFGTHPAQPGDKPALTTRSVALNNQVYPAVSYVRNKSAAGVAITVRASQNVTFGTSADVVQEGTAQDLGNGLERVTVRASSPLQATFFFEVRVATN